jgi:hypothetical protein
MTEVPVAAFGFFSHTRAHFSAIKAMESIPFDVCGRDILATKDLLERPLYGRRARSR